MPEGQTHAPVAANSKAHLLMKKLYASYPRPRTATWPSSPGPDSREAHVQPGLRAQARNASAARSRKHVRGPDYAPLPPRRRSSSPRARATRIKGSAWCTRSARCLLLRSLRGRTSRRRAAAVASTATCSVCGQLALVTRLTDHLVGLNAVPGS